MRFFILMIGVRGEGEGAGVLVLGAFVGEGGEREGR
jgi:hypothetical protein